MHYFTGASLGPGDGGGNIGRRKIACTWDMGKQMPAMSEIKQIFSPGLWNMAREILNMGISHPSEVPSMFSCVFDGLFCSLRGIVPKYPCFCPYAVWYYGKRKKECKIQIFLVATEDSPCPWSVPVRMESSYSLGLELACSLSVISVGDNSAQLLFGTFWLESPWSSLSVPVHFSPESLVFLTVSTTGNVKKGILFCSAVIFGKWVTLELLTRLASERVNPKPWKELELKQEKQKENRCEIITPNFLLQKILWYLSTVSCQKLLAVLNWAKRWCGMIKRVYQ